MNDQSTSKTYGLADVLYKDLIDGNAFNMCFAKLYYYMPHPENAPIIAVQMLKSFKLTGHGGHMKSGVRGDWLIEFPNGLRCIEPNPLFQKNYAAVPISAVKEDSDASEV